MLLHRVLFVVFLALGAISVSAQKTKSESEVKLKSIPVDFTDTKYVLLVQMDGPTDAHIKSHPLGEKKVRAWWDKQMNEKKEYLKDKLSRPYEVVTTDDIFSSDSKYDVNKYRYALIDSARTITTKFNQPNSMFKKEVNTEFYQYYIWDRLTNTLHPGVGVGRGNEMKAFKSAVDRLAGVK